MWIAWRSLPNPSQWQVTPETARLLQHWRHHKFSGVRPFFCQVEAVETAIWLTEVAPQSRNGKRMLDHLASANRDANPELMRLALKLAFIRSPLTIGDEARTATAGSARNEWKSAMGGFASERQDAGANIPAILSRLRV